MRSEHKSSGGYLLTDDAGLPGRACKTITMVIANRKTSQCRVTRLKKEDVSGKGRSCPGSSIVAAV